MTLRMEVGLQLVVGKLTQSLTHIGGSLSRPTHLPDSSSLHFCPISTVLASGLGPCLERIPPFAYPRYRRGRLDASVQWAAACYGIHLEDSPETDVFKMTHK